MGAGNRGGRPRRRLAPEIYFANDFGPDRLLHNRSTPGHPRFELLEGRRSFTTTKSKVLGRDSYKGMGVDFGDLNGDGWPDIYVSNITQEYGLEESHFVFLSTGHVELMKKGVAPYIDRGESLGLSRSGWGWDTRLGDFNNDGVLEALQATGFLKATSTVGPNYTRLLWATTNCSATRVVGPSFKPAMTSAATGTISSSCARRMGVFTTSPHSFHSTSHCSPRIATADVDGDGRLDYAVANQWGTSYFYRNESNNRAPSSGSGSACPSETTCRRRVCVVKEVVTLRFPRPAIGAEARVFLLDGAARAAG